MYLSLPFNNITAYHEKRELQTHSRAWKSVSRSLPKFHPCLCELSRVALLGPCEAWIHSQESCFQKHIGLAKKFVWVFHNGVWKAWTNFLANPMDIFRKSPIAWSWLTRPLQIKPTNKCLTPYLCCFFIVLILSTFMFKDVRGKTFSVFPTQGKCVRRKPCGFPIT